MKIQDLFEDIESDKQNLDTSEQAWKKLLSEVKGYIELGEKDKFESYSKTFSDIMKFVSKITYKIKESNYTINVKFIDNLNPKSAHGTFQTTRQKDGDYTSYRYDMFINYNSNNSNNNTELSSINDFYNNFEKQFEETFIHEYNHFLDSLRSKDQESYTDTKTKMKNKGQYINTPHEFNAFYMQLMKSYKNAFKKRNVVEQFKENPTFENFKDIGEITSDAGRALSNLDEQYKKSYLKRLYQLYKEYYQYYIKNNT